MNRPQFLAELNQYLTFFTPDERAAVMASYTQRFKDAGEEGEAALIIAFGTPMRVAIDLKRRQEAGDNFDDLFGAAPAEPPDYSVETETPESLSEEKEESDPDEKEPITEADEDENEADIFAPQNTVPAAKSSIPKIIGATILSVVLVAIFLCVAAVGALAITAAGYFVMAGLKTLLTLTDALFLFAGGLVLGGVGLLIVWFAIWAAISLISKLFRSARGMNGKERDTK